MISLKITDPDNQGRGGDKPGKYRKPRKLREVQVSTEKPGKLRENLKYMM